MKKNTELQYVEISNLKLDINNPRFGELYNGSKNEEDLIKYLINEEAAEEIAKKIALKKNFYEDKALWVIQDKKDDKFIVKDGNRRCAAVKALQNPNLYDLKIEEFILKELPVYIYSNEEDLNNRIAEEHTASLFRNWERIPKALYILSLIDSGKGEEINELDPRPGDFIRLGSFFKEAVKYGKDDFKQQVRRGRGTTGGKTIIYERLFRDAKSCGYKFRNAPIHTIQITDQNKFEAYIIALIKYIKENPGIKTSIIDSNKKFVEDELIKYGFDVNKNYNPPQPGTGQPDTSQVNAGQPDNSQANAGQPGTGQPDTSQANAGQPGAGQPDTSQANAGQPGAGQPDTSQANAGQPGAGQAGTSQANAGQPGAGQAGTKRNSVKKYPVIKRKQIPKGLKARIDEYFKIDPEDYPNAKIAMARVTYECVLKYIVDSTTHNKILFKNSGHFGSAFSRKPYTNFEELNKKFIDLINDTGMANAFKVFEFDKMHQTIHNFLISSTTKDAEQINNNLIHLIEFMLQDVDDLLRSLCVSKIK